MAMFTSMSDYAKALRRFAEQNPKQLAKAVDAIIHERGKGILAHARANHPRRMSLKEHKLIMFKSIAKRKAGKKLSARGRNRRFQTWTGHLVKSMNGRAVAVGSTIYGRLWAGMDYAWRIEHGSSSNAPHPFLRPAILERAGYMKLRLMAGVKLAMKYGGLSG